MGQQCCGNLAQSDQAQTIESGSTEKEKDKKQKKDEVDLITNSGSKGVTESGQGQQNNSGDLSILKLLNDRKSVLLSKESYQDFLELNPEITKKIIDGSQEEVLTRMLSKEDVLELKNIAQEIKKKGEKGNSSLNNDELDLNIVKLNSRDNLPVVDEKKVEKVKKDGHDKKKEKVSEIKEEKSADDFESEMGADKKKSKKKDKKIVGFDVNDIENAMKNDGNKKGKGGTEYDAQSRQSVKSTTSVKGVLKKYDTSSCYGGDNESMKKRKKKVKFAEPYGKNSKKKSTKRH